MSDSSVPPGGGIVPPAGSDDSAGAAAAGSAGGAGEITGRSIGRYQVKERLGKGGMGEVYRAWDTLLERWVAIKRPSPGSTSDAAGRRRILQEARAASGLHHRAIAGIFDVLDLPGEPYIVEELVNGARLRDRLGAPFDLPAFYTIAEDCADALVAAAEKGIVHCDLKPDNILVTDDGRPKILDFGIARRAVASGEHFATRTQTLVTDSLGLTGTPSYLPPEVISGMTPDARSDIFALGVVFHEMLSGVNPFEKGAVAATLVSVVHDAPPPPSATNPAVTPALDALIARMIAKNPTERFGTPTELLEALRAVRAGTARAPRKPRRPFPLVSAAAGGGLLLVVVALAVWATRSGKSSRAGGGAARYLAVEPFKSICEDNDPKCEFFAGGLTEALEARLASLEGIYVVEASPDVGVKLTLEGTVQRSTDKIRITYRIVDHEKGHNVSGGGGVVEGMIAELFDLQDRAARQISKSLASQFGLAPLAEASEPRPTPDAVAYDLYLQARGYLRRFEDERNVELAIENFQRALDRDPEMPLALAGIGEAYWKRYEATKDTIWVGLAKELSHKALRLGPGLAEPHVTLGTLYLGIGNPDSAAVEFERAVGIDPRSDAAYRGLGKAEEGLGTLDRAEATFRRSIAARPDDWRSNNDLGAFFFRHSRYAEAADCFRRVVELTPDNVRGYSNLGASYDQLDRATDAIAAYEHSIRLKPNFRAYSNLATLYRSQGRFAEAAEMYDKALALDDRDYRVWGNLGGTYQSVPGRTASADSALDRAIEGAERQREINPNDPMLLTLLSQYYAWRGRKEDARQIIERALAIAPDQTDIAFQAAITYELVRDRARALELVRRVIAAGFPADDIAGETGLASLAASPEGLSIIREARSRKSDSGR